MASQTPTVKVYVGAKVADGTEAASTFTTNSTEQSVTRVCRVTGAHASTVPEGTGLSGAAGATSQNSPSTHSWGE